jgi:hypothetical protein
MPKLWKALVTLGVLVLQFWPAFARSLPWVVRVILLIMTLTYGISLLFSSKLPALRRFGTAYLVFVLTFRRPALLFVTEWDVWPSSENWHLYYKLRQTYGDNRLLGDGPGLLFLEHEAEDLASFLQLSMLNGWGGYVLTEANYVNAFFSHDEYIDFFAEDSANLADIRKVLDSNHLSADGRMPHV